MNPVTTFEDLECWKAGREIRLFVFREVMPRLPKEERYRLGDQVIRAGRSITANIAEGHGRFHFLEKSKFCSIARGSCTEVLDHLITANDETMIPDDVLLAGRALITPTVQLLNGYMRYLKRSAHE